MKENPYELVLRTDGDIVIYDYRLITTSSIVYHKSYNLGDDLQENLVNGFKRWKELSDAYFEQDDSQI